MNIYIITLFLLIAASLGDLILEWESHQIDSQSLPSMFEWNDHLCVVYRVGLQLYFTYLSPDGTWSNAVILGSQTQRDRQSYACGVIEGKPTCLVEKDIYQLSGLGMTWESVGVFERGSISTGSWGLLVSGGVPGYFLNEVYNPVQFSLGNNKNSSEWGNFEVASDTPTYQFSYGLTPSGRFCILYSVYTDDERGLRFSVRNGYNDWTVHKFYEVKPDGYATWIPSSLAVVGDKLYAVWINPSQDPALSSTMSITVSTDDGETWSEIKHIFSIFNGNSDTISTIEFNGDLLIAAYASRSIEFITINKEGTLTTLPGTLESSILSMKKYGENNISIAYFPARDETLVVKTLTGYQEVLGASWWILIICLSVAVIISVTIFLVIKMRRYNSL
eukprot:TRINITY_DN2012_c0_g1_i3.p1 TRINITY_DN2012_c0_g1~~TRINITY_DN2012_c0_g1_i3.p1  ORF type:complete len:390 (-),score=86.78 TRINITY_DN2012_c0_g1_i3:24-1193(-)